MAARRADQGASPQSRLERAGQIAAEASTLRPSDPNVRRGLYAGLALLVALGVGLAIVGTLGDLPEFELRARPGWIALAVAGMALYLLAAAELWRRLLRVLGPELEPLPALSVWFTSALGRYVPTSLLYPVMRVAAGDRVGVPKRISLVSLVYEIGMTFASALLVSAYFVIDLPALADQPARFAVLVVPVIAIACLHPRVFHRLTDRVLTRFGRAPLPIALHERAILLFTLGYGATFLLAGISTFGLAECVYPAVELADAPIVAGAFAVSIALSLMAFILPAGIGAREATMVLALSPVMPAAPALAVALLSRILQVALEIAFAVAAPLLARRAARSQSPDG